MIDRRGWRIRLRVDSNDGTIPPSSDLLPRMRRRRRRGHRGGRGDVATVISSPLVVIIVGRIDHDHNPSIVVNCHRRRCSIVEPRLAAVDRGLPTIIVVCPSSPHNRRIGSIGANSNVVGAHPPPLNQPFRRTGQFERTTLERQTRTSSSCQSFRHRFRLRRRRRHRESCDFRRRNRHDIFRRKSGRRRTFPASAVHLVSIVRHRCHRSRRIHRRRRRRSHCDRYRR